MYLREARRCLLRDFQALADHFPMTRGTRNKQVGLAAIISALAVITGISAHANTAPHNYAQPGIVAPEQEFKTDDSTGGFSLGGDMVQPSSLVPRVEESFDSGSRTEAGSTGTEWHDIIVVKALPPGVSASLGKSTDNDIRETISNVDAFYRDRTDGKLRFRLQQLRGWHSVSVCQSSTDPRAADRMWANYADRYNLKRRDNLHVMFWIPSMAACGGAGLGEVGKTRNHGGFSYVAYSSFRGDIAAHEIGHNLGLLHANKLKCNGNILDRPYTGGNQYTDDCYVAGYQDWYDIMGVGWSPNPDNWGTLSPINHQVLGTRAEERVEHKDGSKILHIGAAHSDANPARYPIVVEPNGTKYYLEYRTSAGLNHRMSANRMGERGLLIRRVNANPRTHYYGSREGLLIDMGKVNKDRPSSHTHNALLTVGGGTFLSATGRLKIQMLEAHADRAVLKVVVDGKEPQAPAAPEPTVKAALNITTSLTGGSGLGSGTPKNSVRQSVTQGATVETTVEEIRKDSSQIGVAP